MNEAENEKMSQINLSSSKNPAELKPIVLDYKKRKKKTRADKDAEKARYSRGFEDIQRLEGDMVRITQKATKALSKGVDTYERERNQSAKQKKDGAAEDFVYNSAKATSAYLKEASDIPIDAAEMMYTKSYRKNMRRLLRGASRSIRMWRI